MLRKWCQVDRQSACGWYEWDDLLRCVSVLRFHSIAKEVTASLVALHVFYLFSFMLFVCLCYEMLSRSQVLGHLKESAYDTNLYGVQLNLC